MKKGIIFVLTAVLAAGGAGGYYYWKNGELPYKDVLLEQLEKLPLENIPFLQELTNTEERVSSDSEDAVYVDSVKVLAGLGSGTGVIQRYAGVIEPQETWEVKLENERTVEECFVKEGDMVKKGQKLFTYSVSEAEDKLAQAEIDRERCLNDIESAKARIEQYEKEKKKASSDEQLSYSIQISQEQVAIRTSEHEYKSKELEIERLKEQVTDSVVSSEIDGVVKSINDPDDGGSYMSDSTSDAAYITVLQVGDYRVKGTVNEQNIDQITEGMDMIVHSRVDDSIIWRGYITEINRDKGESNTSSSYYYSSSDSSTSSTNYPFYIELSSVEGLMLGQHVYMEPDFGQEDEKEGLWLDDYYFVINDDGSAYTWAVSSSDKLEKRDVTLGEYDNELSKYQILDGLTEEDYITVPYDELTDGLPVIYNDYPTDGGYAYDGDDMMYGEDISYDDVMYDEDMSYDDVMFDDAMSDDDVMYEEDMSDDDVMYEEDMSYDAKYERDMEYYDADTGEAVMGEELSGLSEDVIYEEEVVE